MTKKEAIKQMEIGAKITHSTFLPDEWITMRNGIIIDELGLSLFNFWNNREGEIYQTGWEEYNEPIST